MGKFFKALTILVVMAGFSGAGTVAIFPQNDFDTCEKLARSTKNGVCVPFVVVANPKLAEIWVFQTEYFATADGSDAVWAVVSYGAGVDIPIDAVIWRGETYESPSLKVWFVDDIQDAGWKKKSQYRGLLH